MTENTMVFTIVKALLYIWLIHIFYNTDPSNKCVDTSLFLLLMSEFPPLRAYVEEVLLTSF